MDRNGQPLNEYSQKRINNHSEKIELSHLKRKTLYVNGILMLFMFPTLYLLHLIDVSLSLIFIYSAMFLFVFIVNIAFYTYKDHFNNLKISMYITILGIYIIITSLMIDIMEPSIFTLLFFAYAIVYLYQDKQAMILNNLLLFALGSMLILFYPESLNITTTQTGNIVYLITFLAIFVILLMLSSTVIIKRTLHFYRKVAFIKEEEIKTIDLLFDLQKKYEKTYLDEEKYYEKLGNFTEALSRRIGIDNVFEDKINFLKALQAAKTIEIEAISQSYSETDINELIQLALDKKNNQISYTLFKASQSSHIKIDSSEIYSEKESPSLRSIGDSLETKVLLFSVVYILARTDRYLVKSLSNEEFVKLLTESDFYQLIEPKILKIYLENNEVFDKIFSDAFYDQVKL